MARTADKLEGFAHALRKVDDPDLPPITSTWTGGDAIAVQVWLALAPITALTRWEAQMTGPIDRRATPTLDSEGEPIGVWHVSSTGVLFGTEVTVCTVTHSEVTADADGRVAEATFAALALAERPLTDPGDDHILAALLTEWADPDVEVHDLDEVLAEVGVDPSELLDD